MRNHPRKPFNPCTLNLSGNTMDNDMDETRALVLEKRQLEGRLREAGGDDFGFLLQDCTDLSDIIDEIEDVSSQMGEKEHAAFEAKIKFSRKVRRKAKDMKNFEQHLVSEYENRRITLEHGKRMVSIIKLLRSKSVDKARREAKEFHEFLEMGARLEMIDGLLLKKRAQVERAKRGAEAQLSGLEWLENEPPADVEKVKRHEEGARLAERLSCAWQAHLKALKSLPLSELLLKMKGEGFGKLGFPGIEGHDADALASFLQKNRLEAKTAQELHGMAGQSEQLLRHLEVDLPSFRQEVVARRGFLSGIMSFSADACALETGSPALDYLSAHDDDARKLAGRISELGKTREQDRAEWERSEKIKRKKEELAGAGRAALEKALAELRALEDVLDGKTAPAMADERKKQKGAIDAILKFLGGK